jgi:hypothetical protein
MTQHPLLQPVVVLLAWSMIMFIWMYATRIPAMLKAGIDLKNRVGGQGKDLDAVLPAETQWKAHNYNHLMEQPTLFYAASFALIVTGCESLGALYAAWGYVALRIVHSLIQAITNRIRYRFLVFLLASLCLIVMIGFAVCSVFWGG